MTNYSLKVRQVKKSDYSLFINFVCNSLKNRIIHYVKALIIHYSLLFLAYYSLFIIKKGHYSLIITPHPDPHIIIQWKYRCASWIFSKLIWPKEGGGVLRYFHIYVGSDYFLLGLKLWISIFLGFWWKYGRFCWVITKLEYFYLGGGGVSFI